MSLTYTLVRECLSNVEDVAGRWQIEGGGGWARPETGGQLVQREAGQLRHARSEHNDAVADAVLPERTTAGEHDAAWCA